MALELIQAITNSDVFSFSQLSYRATFNPDFGGQLKPVTQARPSFCVAKPSSTLAFSLNTATELALDPGVDLALRFDGTDGGPVDGGGRLIVWELNPNIAKHDFTITVDGLGAVGLQVKSVSGRFATIVHEKKPWTLGDCQGVERRFQSHLQLTEGTNALTIQGNALGTDITVDVRITGLAAEASMERRIKAHIRPVKDECGVVGVALGTARFWAEVTGVGPKDKVQYFWDAFGAVPKGSKNQWAFEVETPHPGEILIKLEVDGPEGAVRDQLTVMVLSLQGAIAAEKMCKLRHFVRVNMFANPLWDPLRDLVTRPYSRAELTEMRRTAGELRRLASDLLRPAAKAT